MSWVWLTGKISMEDLMEDHPLEFERIAEEEKRKQLLRIPELPAA